MHGGSYVLGSAYGYRPLAGALAAAFRTNVLIPDYRLAPEHSFPAALDDVHTAYSWLLEQAVDPRNLIIAGDSNGAAIALALLLRCRDEGIPLPAGAVLLCPAPSIEADTIRAIPDEALRKDGPRLLERAVPTPTSPDIPPMTHSSARCSAT